jgi:hypothetical protein
MGQNPQAQAIASAAMAHIQQHLAFEYKKQMQEMMGMPLPTGEEDEAIPRDLEVQISQMAVDASNALLQRNQTEIAAQQAQQAANLKATQRGQIRGQMQTGLQGLMSGLQQQAQAQQQESSSAQQQRAKEPDAAEAEQQQQADSPVDQVRARALDRDGVRAGIGPHQPQPDRPAIGRRRRGQAQAVLGGVGHGLQVGQLRAQPLGQQRVPRFLGRRLLAARRPEQAAAQQAPQPLGEAGKILFRRLAQQAGEAEQIRAEQPRRTWGSPRASTSGGVRAGCRGCRS